MTRSAWVQALLFLVVAAVVIPFGINYVVGPQAFGGRVQLNTHMADARGLEEGVSVSYLGVPVGRVGAVELDPAGGARVQLNLDAGTQVPVDSVIRVGTSGAIGIQAVDIVPGESAEHLTDGAQIGAPESAQPPALAEVMGSAADLVETVDPQVVRGLADEAATALAGTGPTLAGLIDDGAIIAELLARRAPDLRVITEQFTGVSAVTAARGDDFVAGTAALRDVLVYFEDAGAAIDRVLDRAPAAADEMSVWLDRSAGGLDGLIPTLGSVLPVYADREAALGAILDDLPFAMRRLSSIVDGDRADFVLIGTQGPVCGYTAAVRRMVGDTAPVTVSPFDYCAPAPNLATRGAYNAPRPDRLGMVDYRDPGVEFGPPMARDPLLLPTGVQMLDEWTDLRARMEEGR